jgi:hypothetical protein
MTQDYREEIVPESEVVRLKRPSKWDALAARVLKLLPGKAMKLIFPTHADLAMTRHPFRCYVETRNLPIDIVSGGEKTLYLRKKGKR